MEKGAICGGAVTRVGSWRGSDGDDDQAISQIPNPMAMIHRGDMERQRSIHPNSYRTGSDRWKQGWKV